MSKNFFKVKAAIAVIGVFLLFYLLSGFSQLRAGTITSITVSLSENGVSATSSYTISFTPETNLPSGGLVLVSFIFPEGGTFGLSSASLDTGTTSSEITAISDTQSNLLVFSTNGLSAGTAYTIKVDNITNPSKAGMGVLAIATQSSGSYIDGDLSTSPPQVLSSSFQIGTAAFKGKVTDPSGNPVNGAWVNAFPASSSGGQPQGGSSNFNGDYLIPPDNITSGTDYYLEVFPPFSGSGSNLISPDRVTQTYNGSAITQDFQFLQATKTITGKVTYSTGGDVSNATINVFKTNGAGFVQGTTNASGVYTVMVAGGSWEVIPQATSTSDWAYGEPPERVKFANDTTSESKTINFSVDKATATITGRILKPDGNPATPSDGIGGVGVFSMEGKGGGGQVDSNGNFSVRVPAGTYKLEVWTPPESIYGSPSLDPVSVADNQTVNLGNLTLVLKDATITGWVRTEGGSGVSGVEVNAFVRDGGGFSFAQTDVNGNYTMRVVSGRRWMVMPFFGPTSSYALDQPPQEVTVSSGGTATVNFTVKRATATISGVVQDESGSPLSIYGYAFAEKSGGEIFGPGGLGGPIERGSFSFKVPAGSYTVKVALAPGSGYTPGSGVAVNNITDSETRNIAVTLKTNDAVISGSIVDDTGAAVPSSIASQLFVFAISGGSDGHTFQEGIISGNSYSISVAAGEWSLGYFIDPASGYMSAPPDPTNKLTVSSGGTVTKNIVLKQATSTITGRVTNPDGSAAVGVFVSVDNRETEGKEFFNGAPTDSNGNYTIRIADGTYKVRANVAPSSGYLSPPEQTVAVSSETKTVNFTLRSSDAAISGKVTLDGSGVAAFVYAWADDGGFAQSLATSSGDYTLAVSKGTIWHVGARYESGTTPYEASETTVNITGSTATLNLTLSQATYSLPQSLTVTFDATKPKLVTLTDGTEINIPASSLATSGNVTLRINPKASLPAKKADKPVWYGYEFSATDSSGQTITKFNSSVTITLPYTDEQLTNLGITADDLIPSYWDTTSGTWKKFSNVTVNTTTKTVTITTDHFTDFALTANITTAAAVTTTTSTVSTTAAGEVSRPMVPKSSGAVLEVFDNEVVLMVPAGGVEWDADFELRRVDTGFKKPKPPLWIATGPYQIKMKSWFNGAFFDEFKKSSSIILRYDPKALGGIPENSLRVNYYDETTSRWRPLSSVWIKDRYEVAVVIEKIHGIYALIGGFGYQGVPYFVEETVTVEADSKEVGFDKGFLPKREVKKEKKKEVKEEVQAPLVSPKPPVKSEEGFFTRLFRFLRKIIPFMR